MTSLAILRDLSWRHALWAMESIRVRHEADPNPEYGLLFHNRHHTTDVVRRTSRILMALREESPHQVSLEEVVLGEIAAAGHDVDQVYRLKPQADGRIIRHREMAVSEQQSAQHTVDFIQRYAESWHVWVDHQDVQSIRQAVIATATAWSPSLGTVIHPYLGPDSPRIAWALCLGDVMTGPMDGPLAYLRAGDLLFREENVDIGRAVSAGTLSIDELQAIRPRVIEWAQGQIDFITGLERRFNDELTGLPAPIRRVLRQQIGRFTECRQFAAFIANERRALTPLELLRSIGYDV